MKELFTLYYHRRILFTDFFSQSLWSLLLLFWQHQNPFLVHKYMLFHSYGMVFKQRPKLSAYGDCGYRYLLRVQT